MLRTCHMTISHPAGQSSTGGPQYKAQAARGKPWVTAQQALQARKHLIASVFACSACQAAVCVTSFNADRNQQALRAVPTLLAAQALQAQEVLQAVQAVQTCSG